MSTGAEPIRWRGGEDGGALLLPGGHELVVVPQRGRVAFAGGALTLSGVFPPNGESDGIELSVEHPFPSLHDVRVPHLAPDEGFVIGDFVFRSPAVILGAPELAVALLPDLDDVGASRGWRAWLDYDHPRRRVTLGAGAYRHEGHVLFVRERFRCSGEHVSLRLHVLASARAEDRANPFGMVSRWLWARWGGDGYERGGAQCAALSRYSAWIARWAFSEKEGWGETVWQSLTLAGQPAGAPVFIVDVTRHPSVPPPERRWRERRSIWNQAWFSTQRCANGLWRYARQLGSEDLERRARLMTRIALSAPQAQGLFPSVLASAEPSAKRDDGWERARWTNSDRRPESASERACHLADAAFTCRMLLEWHRITADPGALAYLLPFARRLVDLQRPSGAFPGWVEPDGRIVAELAESAESAVGVALLFELSRMGGDTTFRDAALAGMRFLEGVIADGRWEDFETYYSCCRFGTPDLIGKRVARNGVYKQNTLSIGWCADAALEAWLSTGETRYLDLARRVIDELSLYQAVWDPPFLTAAAHGGFGVMNADSEWNDARQSLFAPLYLELYRHIGDIELFERGVSALRASFAMLYCPENVAVARAYERRFPFFGPESYGFMMENQGHSGAEPIGEFTIFSWGNGSALAAAATIRDGFGDVYIDEARGRALPIDGLTAAIDGERVVIEDRFDRPEIIAAYADRTRRAVRLLGGRGAAPLCATSA